MIIKEEILRTTLKEEYPNWTICDIYHIKELDNAIALTVKYYDNKCLRGRIMRIPKNIYFETMIKLRNDKIKQIIR